MGTTTENLSLYAIHDEVQAYYDSLDLCETPEDRAACQAELAKYIELQVRKVDGVAEYLIRCENEQSWLKAEAERVQARQQEWATKAKRLEKFVAGILDTLPQPKRGSKKLEGKIHTLSLRAGSASVVIEDESAIPAEYKTATIKMAVDGWERHIWEFNFMREKLGLPAVSQSDLDFLLESNIVMSKTAIKAAFKAGREVPGADIDTGSPTVVVK